MAEQTTAIHEAGHAVAALVLGLPVTYLTIIPEPGSVGRVTLPWTQEPSVLEVGEITSSQRAKWHDRVVALLAGYEAQRRFSPQSCRHYMVSEDRESAVDICEAIHRERRERDAALVYLELRAANLVQHRVHWAVILNFARVLVETKRMRRADIRAVWCQSLKQATLAP